MQNNKEEKEVPIGFISVPCKANSKDTPSKAEIEEKIALGFPKEKILKEVESTYVYEDNNIQVSSILSYSLGSDGKFVVIEFSNSEVLTNITKSELIEKINIAKRREFNELSSFIQRAIL
jgi:hypothetical protein